MRLKGGYTPRAAAYDIAIGWLRAAATEKSGDIADYANTPSERKALIKAVTKLHDSLLIRSKLDGLLLTTEEPKHERNESKRPEG